MEAIRSLNTHSLQNIGSWEHIYFHSHQKCLYRCLKNKNKNKNKHTMESGEFEDVCLGLL